MAKINQVTIGGKTYAIHGFRGDVASSQKQKETRVSGSGGGGGPHYTQNVQITSTTIDHHELFLVNRSGEERNFKFVNWDIPCREGQNISVLWAIREGREQGPYVRVINNNLKQQQSLKPGELASEMRPPWYISWGIAIVAAIVLSTFMGWGGFFLGLAAPLVYFWWRSRQDAGKLLNSPELQRAEETLSVG
ncbi:MAG: hypothetical protein Tsb0016_20120 [Sphingomonadales bacterium]